MNVWVDSPKPEYTYDVESVGQNEIVYFDLLHVLPEKLKIAIEGFRLRVESVDPDDKLSVLVEFKGIPKTVLDIKYNDTVAIITVDTGSWR